MSYHEAIKKLPADAKLSSAFGYFSQGNYIEYWRQPDGTRWIVSNGPWHLIECEFDWQCQQVEETKRL